MMWKWIIAHGKLVAYMIIAIETIALIAVIIGILRYSKENERLSDNISSLPTPAATVEFRTTGGRSVAGTKALNLKISELKETNDSLLTIVKDLGIKNRRLTALAQATTATAAAVEAPVRDSIVWLPGRTDTLRCMSFADAWLSFNGCIRADTLQGTIECRDTLDFIAHRVPKRFLFFRFGCKAVRLDVVSHNPHGRLTFARYIRIE